MERRISRIDKRNPLRRSGHIVDNASYYVPHTENDTAKSKSPERTSIESLRYKRDPCTISFLGMRECGRRGNAIVLYVFYAKPSSLSSIVNKSFIQGGQWHHRFFTIPDIKIRFQFFNTVFFESHFLYRKFVSYSLYFFYCTSCLKFVSYSNALSIFLH